MASVQSPTFTSFNNSLVVQQTKFDAKKFTDLPHLYEWFKKDSFTNYKGLVSLWNQRQIINTPLLNMTELKNNIIYVNGPEGKFSYSMPYDLGLPIILENLEKDNAKPGIDGQKFKIKLSDNCFTNTDTLTYDYRDGLNLIVTEDEVYQEGDGFVYTVQIVSFDKKNTYMPSQYLQPGTQYMKISNANGEYDTQKSSINMRNGMLRLESQIGAARSVEHWITGWADMVEIENDQFAYLNRLYGNMQSDNAVTVIGNRDPKTGKGSPGTGRWIKTIEMMLFAEIAQMEERELMWAQGGIVSGSGRSAKRINQGLYQQLRNGNRYTYSKLTRGLIVTAISNMFRGSGIPIEKRKIRLQSGEAATIELSKLFNQEFAKTPFLVTANSIPGFIKGDAMNLSFGYRFAEMFIPEIGHVSFEHNPAFDATYNRASDAFGGSGYPIQSYTIAILDVTDDRWTNAASKIESKVEYQDGFDQGSNIFLVKPKNFDSTYWGYIVGTHHPYGPSAMKGMFSSNSRDGYGMWIKNQSSIWLKDATRSILIEKERV